MAAEETGLKEETKKEVEAEELDYGKIDWETLVVDNKRGIVTVSGIESSLEDFDWPKHPDHPRAKKWGFQVPKDFDSESGKNFVDPGTFVDNQRAISDSYRKDAKGLRRDVDRLAKLLEDLKKESHKATERDQKQVEREQKKILSELKDKRDAAVDEGDKDLVGKITDQMLEVQHELKEDVEEEEAEITSGAKSPVVLRWMEDNKDWYEDFDNAVNSALTNTMNVSTTNYGNEHPEAAWPEILEYGEKQVKKERKRFEKLLEEKKTVEKKVSKVGGGDPAKGGGKTKTYADLPPEAKEACDTFVNQGDITREKYVEGYFKEAK